MTAIKRFRIRFVFIFLVIFSVNCSPSLAQEETYMLADEDIFGKLRRPAVVFQHEIHTDILSDEDCITCHHDEDENTGKLIYTEGEEQSCKECHAAYKEGDKPALREAFHGSCTICHRRLIKKKEQKTGPTTCGECHTKE